MFMLIMALTHMVQGTSFTARLFRHLRTIRDTRKVPEFRTSKLDSNKHQQDHFMYAPRQAKPDRMGDGVHIRPVYGLMQSCKYVEQAGTIPGICLRQWSVIAPYYYYDYFLLFLLLLLSLSLLLLLLLLSLLLLLLLLLLFLFFIALIRTSLVCHCAQRLIHEGDSTRSDYSHLHNRDKNAGTKSTRV